MSTQFQKEFSCTLTSKCCFHSLQSIELLPVLDCLFGTSVWDMFDHVANVLQLLFVQGKHFYCPLALVIAEEVCVLFPSFLTQLAAMSLFAPEGTFLTADILTYHSSKSTCSSSTAWPWHKINFEILQHHYHK